MSIVSVQRVTFVGMVEEKGQVLEELQALGCLHLRSLQPSVALQPTRQSLSEETRTAWRFLKDCPRQRLQVTRSQRYDPEEMQARALQLQEQLADLGDERDFLRKRIADVQRWGDFRFAPTEEMDGLSLWFYIVPHEKLEAVAETGLTWEIVNDDSKHFFVVVVSESEPAGMPVERVLVGARPLSELELRLEEVEEKLDELEFEREGLTRGLTIYERNMGRLEDITARAKAAQLTLDSDLLFALEAWAPREREEELREFAARNGLAVQIEEPGEEDDPPTLLRNPSKWQVGESLVKFYMTPNYRLWDPSMVVLFSFALFFAMIISDAGYGAVMVALLLLGRKKLRGTAGGVLCSLLAYGTVVWGVLVGSYFGLSPAEGSFLAKLKILDLTDMDTMMKLSILIGSAHVIMANAVTSWRQRSSAAAFAPLGWIVAISGALVLWLGGESLGPAGAILLAAGLALVFLFSGAGQGGGFFKRLAMGFMGLTKVTSAFGDILSYLRLFALGLASASLALAFNDLAHTAREGLGGFGILVALVVLVVGHTLNFVLAIVSGFVHGLRLNLIEFFNWSVDEEGVPFEAFSKREPDS